MRKSFLSLIVAGFVFSHALEANCGPQLRVEAAHPSRNLIQEKIERLMASPEHKEYFDTLELLNESYNKRETFVAFFEKKDMAEAMAQIDTKTEKFLDVVENKLIPAKGSERRMAEIYGSTFSDLGYRALNLEDEPPLAKLWRATFASEKAETGGVSLKLGQTDSVKEIDYWMPLLDKNTFLFLDADLPGEKLVGFRIAEEAVKLFSFNPNRVIMASSQDAIAKERGIRNVDKRAVEAKLIMLNEVDPEE